MPKQSNRGGKRPGSGRPPKPPGEKYQGMYIKLPPVLIDWLNENTSNKNGFIVEAIKEKIESS